MPSLRRKNKYDCGREDAMAESNEARSSAARTEIAASGDDGKSRAIEVAVAVAAILGGLSWTEQFMNGILGTEIPPLILKLMLLSGAVLMFFLMRESKLPKFLRIFCGVFFALGAVDLVVFLFKFKF
jgi:hypothetical protein